jgi:glycine/D-amino acid oxidase-like deaminating enzyme
MKWDYIIVGQGIAGTLLHYFLDQSESKILIVDQYKQSASRISSGILNPLTGRKYVKSWMFDKLIEQAVPSYQEISAKLGLQLFQSLPILRALPNRKAEIEWDYRSSLPEYEKYIGSKLEWGEVEQYINKDIPYVSIKNGYHIHMPKLVEAYRSYLKEKELLLEAKFEYDDVIFEEDEVNWRNHKAGNIIFCEGAGATMNPFFKYLPFNPSKGEAMTVEVPFTLQRVVKKTGFIVPWSEKKMWVGSASFWNYEHDQPTETGEQRIRKQLEDMYSGPYEKIKSLAAEKPGVKDRRPFLGTHPKFDRLHIFNGLGTKGASLAPYFAREMADYLIKDKPIDKMVDIQRFNNKS